MKPTLELCSSHSATGISKTPGLVTSLEPVPLLFRARGTTGESWIEGAKHTKHTQREGLYDLRIRFRGVGHTTLHTEYCYSCRRCQRLYSVYSGLTPLQGGKAISAFCLGGLAVHHWSVRGGSFAKFHGLVNYKGDCRQDAQPIPNSYIN